MAHSACIFMNGPFPAPTPGYGRPMAPAIDRFRCIAPVLAIVLVLAPVAGCDIRGGGSSDEDDARAVAKDYAAAIADGDEKKICDTLSADSKKQLERGDDTCEEAFKNFGGVLDDEQKEQLRDLDPDVEVDGDSATAQVDERPLEGEVRLKKEGGDWKVSLQ
jgi:hypothetical protein